MTKAQIMKLAELDINRLEELHTNGAMRTIVQVASCERLRLLPIIEALAESRDALKTQLEGVVLALVAHGSALDTKFIINHLNDQLHEDAARMDKLK